MSFAFDLYSTRSEEASRFAPLSMSSSSDTRSDTSGSSGSDSTDSSSEDDDSDFTDSDSGGEEGFFRGKMRSRTEYAAPVSRVPGLALGWGLVLVERCPWVLMYATRAQVREGQLQPLVSYWDEALHASAQEGGSPGALHTRRVPRGGRETGARRR